MLCDRDPLHHDRVTGCCIVRGRLAPSKPMPDSRHSDMSIIRRIATVLLALAFLASAPVHVMSAAAAPKADGCVASPMHGAIDGHGKACGDEGPLTDADCKVTCLPVLALAPESAVVKEFDLHNAWARTSDRAATHETAPDTSPPRS